jgi:hypothetical protein
MQRVIMCPWEYHRLFAVESSASNHRFGWLLNLQSPLYKPENHRPTGWPHLKLQHSTEAVESTLRHLFRAGVTSSLRVLRWADHDLRAMSDDGIQPRWFAYRVPTISDMARAKKAAHKPIPKYAALVNAA